MWPREDLHCDKVGKQQEANGEALERRELEAEGYRVPTTAWDV
jgi:hypothetical protein